MEEREVLLQVEDLSVDFRVDRKTTLHAVRNVSFEVYKGETLGILGESGCGKSVTCMSVLQLEPARTTKYPSGRILFSGQDLLKMTPAELRRIRGNRDLHDFSGTHDRVESAVHHRRSDAGGAAGASSAYGKE